MVTLPFLTRGLVTLWCSARQKLIMRHYVHVEANSLHSILAFTERFVELIDSHCCWMSGVCTWTTFTTDCVRRLSWRTTVCLKLTRWRCDWCRSKPLHCNTTALLHCDCLRQRERLLIVVFFVFTKFSLSICLIGQYFADVGWARPENFVLENVGVITSEFNVVGSLAQHV